VKVLGGYARPVVVHPDPAPSPGRSRVEADEGNHQGPHPAEEQGDQIAMKLAGRVDGAAEYQEADDRRSQ